VSPDDDYLGFHFTAVCIWLTVCIIVGLGAWGICRVWAGGDTPATAQVSAQRAGAWVNATDRQAASADVDLAEIARQSCPQGQRLTDWQTTTMSGTTVGVAGRCESGTAQRWFGVVDRDSAPVDAKLAAALDAACPGGVDDWRPVLLAGTTVGAVGTCAVGV
jgi:hypothetical protein